MNKRFLLRFIIIFLILAPLCLFSQTKQWSENRFSMFIHFGLYSELGGVWNGENITYGYSEQILAHGVHYSDLYSAVAEKFNPLEWDAEQIVRLAKNTGMGSIVITAKHHDGFCMYDSEFTDYNIVDATPYKKDILKSLADACAKEGLGFGLYFSLIDWHFPEASPISHHNTDPITPAHHNYNKNQVSELLTSYGPISELWFDMGSLTPLQSEELYNIVHSLQPDCMVSSRLGNDCSDFIVMPDNVIASDYIGIPWQAPGSIYPETWGYRSWQKHEDVEVKAQEKFNDLKRIVSLGGTYLLNIGPTGNGDVPEHEEQVLSLLEKKIKADSSVLRPIHTDLTQKEVESAISYMDYYISFDSKIAYNWKLPLKRRQKEISILYALSDVGREIVIEQKAGKDTITLSLNAVRVELENSGVVFGDANISSVQDGFSLTEVEGTLFTALTKKKDGKFLELLPIKRKQSYLVTQTINAPKDCDYLVELIFTSAVRVLLNEQEIASIKRKDIDRIHNTIVRLPLKKGENTITLSYFSYVDAEMMIGFIPNIKQAMLVLKLPIEPIKGKKEISIRISAADKYSASDMELHNLITSFP